MTSPLRVALIGFGLGGASFHAPLIAATPGMRLATVMTRNPERRAAALRDYLGVQVVDDAEWIWRHASDHDLVVISTTNRSHLALALAALDAGLPVVIDKPFTVTSQEARQVIAKARDRKLLVSAYHIRRWDTECLTLRKLMADGALGNVLRFESRLERWRPQPKGGWRELAAPQEGGGLLYDIGSHLIDQALYLFGPVREVYAELDVRRETLSIDDDVFVALTHASGVRSHLWTSYLAAAPGPRMRVMGDRGSYIKPLADLQEVQLREGARPGGPGWGADPEERWGVFSDGVTSKPVPSVPGAFQSFYAGIDASLRTGAAPPVDAQDAVTGREIIEAARRSAAERQVVTL